MTAVKTAKATAKPEVTPAQSPIEPVSHPGKPRATMVPVTVDSTTIEFPIRLGADGPVYFALGVRKSGSTMLHRLINFLANRNNINAVDMPSTFFRNGFTVSNWSNLDLTPLIAPGNIYLGFRSFPAQLAGTDVLHNALKIFMHRDPRDALVSQYFSDAYSHEIPTTEAAGEGRELFLKKREEARAADIDAWVLEKVGGIRKTLEVYGSLLDDPKCLVLRYEDYVFQKRRMIDKILKHFGWTVEPARLNRFLSDLDVVPDSEDKSRFVRKVIPGDHVAKLKPETIRRLNRRLADVMTIYDYH